VPSGHERELHFLVFQNLRDFKKTISIPRFSVFAKKSSVQIRSKQSKTHQTT